MDPIHYKNLINFKNENIFPLNFSEKEQKQLKNQAEHYIVKNSLLYKISKNSPNILFKVVQPFELNSVLYMFHNDPTAAHTSKERMMEKLKKRYFWPQMFKDIESYVKSCDACQRRGKSK